MALKDWAAKVTAPPPDAAENLSILDRLGLAEDVVAAALVGAVAALALVVLRRLVFRPAGPLSVSARRSSCRWLHDMRGAEDGGARWVCAECGGSAAADPANPSAHPEGCLRAGGPVMSAREEMRRADGFG